MTTEVLSDIQQKSAWYDITNKCFAIYYHYYYSTYCRTARLFALPHLFKLSLYAYRFNLNVV